MRSTIVRAIDQVIGVMKQSSLFQLSKDYQLAFRCQDSKHTMSSIEGLGHEPIAVIDCENPDDPQIITYLKCKKTNFLSPSMCVWFGKVSKIHSLHG